MASLAGAAIWYARQGLLVFPLKPRAKTPATRHGFRDASMSEDTVRAWWAKEPRYNIGLSTGHLFDVIDVDGDAGIMSATILEDERQVPPTIGIVATPRGFHLMIRPTGDGCATNVLPGIDYRGIGGYVVAPPSINEDGTVYRWIDPLNLS